MLSKASFYYVEASFLANVAPFSWYDFSNLPIIQFGHAGYGIQGQSLLTPESPPPQVGHLKVAPQGQSKNPAPTVTNYFPIAGFYYGGVYAYGIVPT